MTITLKRKDNRGFTLIEMMIVIVIASILMAVAVPSFSDLIKRNTAESVQTKMVSAVSTARTEAASRNNVITVCARLTDAACDPAAATATEPNNWPAGWIVFADMDRDGVPDDGESIDIHRYDGDYSVRVQGTGGNVASFRFNSQGFLMNDATVGANVLIRICEPGGEARFTRGLYVNASGLVMKTRDGNNDGVQDDPRLVGTTATANLTCN